VSYAKTTELIEILDSFCGFDLRWKDSIQNTAIWFENMAIWFEKTVKSHEIATI